MHYVISDLHGYPPEDLGRLLASAGFSGKDELWVLGDVIDRNGDGGIGMLRWMMAQPNVFFLLGNHEHMLLLCDFLFEEVTEESLDRLGEDRLSLLLNWLGNGAAPTIAALRKLKEEDREELDALLEYLREAPLYEVLEAGGRRWVLTHAGLGGYTPGKRLGEYSEEELLWYRPSLTERWSDRFTAVFGHTPTVFYGEEYQGRILRTPTWIDIDTGAAGGLSPTLLRLEDEKTFTG